MSKFMKQLTALLCLIATVAVCVACNSNPDTGEKQTPENAQEVTTKQTEAPTQAETEAETAEAAV